MMMKWQPFMNPKVHRSKPLDSEPDEYNLHPHTIFKIHFNIILPYMPTDPQWSLSFRFPIKIVHAFHSPLVHGTCPTHLVLLALITLIISDEEYKL
jgi:hypothetical protein